LEGFKLPQINAINRYVSAYISELNQHIPFLHLPTLNLNELEIARLLAICSLGALYCFEKENARKLHVAAMTFLKHVCLLSTDAEFRRWTGNMRMIFLILRGFVRRCYLGCYLLRGVEI
jgi:hypothetical protein